MMHLLWCTIRPDVFLTSYNEWIQRSDNPNNIKTKVCVNTETDKNYLNSKISDLEIHVTDKPERVGVAYPSYVISSKVEGSEDDIVVFASDDFLPPNGWDTFVSERLFGKTACLMVNDGYQALDFSNMAEPVFSIPIMTFSALTKLNKVIYNPVYNHLCSDAELYLNAKELGLILDTREKDTNYVFEHYHWSSGKRRPDQFDQNYYSKFENDKKTWEMRKNLPLNERLIVQI